MGSGFRTFQSGEVLTSSNVQNFLMDQSVMVFGGTAARSSAITSPEEGMITYDTATDLLEVYNGSKFKAFASMGTATTSGSVLQVVSTTKTDTFTTTSTSYTDLTGLSASITPAASSSLVLVQVSINQAVSGDILGTYQLVRGSTAIALGDAAGSRTRATFGIAPGAANGLYTQAHFTFLDSPATTSATTYKMQLRTNSGTLFVNRSATDTDTTTFSRTISTITLFEVST